MKNLIKISVLLALLQIFSVKTRAQEINLGTGWKFRTGDHPNWAKVNYNDKNWKPVQTSLCWEKQGYPDYNGYAWYRIKVIIPSSLKQKSYLKDSLKIILGKIDDCDQTFLNGVKIGQNGGLPGTFEKVKAYDVVRRYAVSAKGKLIRWDRPNVIAVRVYDQQGNGGLIYGKLSMSMIDLNDIINIEKDKTNFRHISGNYFKKTVYLRTTSKKHKFLGIFNIKVITNDNFKKIIVNKNISAKISKNKILAGSFTYPDNQDGIAIYSYFDKKSLRVIREMEEVPYIATPRSPKFPRINGAKIFGVRPGNPFLFTIAATGLKPITFTAHNLPEGLTLDENSGQITGKIQQKGTYEVELTAHNKLGKTNRELKIVVGDTISLTPPLGWNSWNCWGLSINEDKVKKAADAMKSTGLINHGWTYINIDDGWEKSERTANGEIQFNDKFKDMTALSAYIHSKGLKLGIYSSPGPKTCGNFLGSYQHELQDVQSYTNWGIDYLKYDWCSYDQIAPNKSLEELQRPYKLMQECLSKVNRDIHYSLCQYGMGEVWKWGAEINGNSWRTTGDIQDNWQSMAGIGFTQNACAAYTRPGHWNDPDMLVVGRVGWGTSLHNTNLTPNEQYTHISLWCLLSAPLLIGCNLGQIDDFTLNLLTNDEVLAVNQDPLAKPAKQNIKNDTYQIWSKELEDGSKAVGIFNVSRQNAKVTLHFNDLDISGTQIIRDLWKQKDLPGNFKNEFTTWIPAHGVMLVKISDAKMRTRL